MSSVTDIIRPYFSPHDTTSLWVIDNRVKALGNWTDNVYRPGVYHAASVASALARDIHNLVVDGDIKVVEIGWWMPGHAQQRQHIAVRMDMDPDTKNRVFAMRGIWEQQIPGLIIFPAYERKIGWYGRISTTNLTYDDLPVVPCKGIKQDRKGGYMWTWFLDRKQASAQAKLNRLEVELEGEGELVYLETGLHDFLRNSAYTYSEQQLHHGHNTDARSLNILFASATFSSTPPPALTLKWEKARASTSNPPAAASTSVLPAAASTSILPAAASTSIPPAVAAGSNLTPASTSTPPAGAAGSTLIPPTVESASTSTPLAVAAASTSTPLAAASVTTLAASIPTPLAGLTPITHDLLLATAKRSRQESGESAQSRSRPPRKQAKRQTEIASIRDAIAAITVDEEEIQKRQREKAECERKAAALEDEAKAARAQARQHQIYLTNARQAKRELLKLQMQLNDLEDDDLGDDDLEDDDGLCEEEAQDDGL